MRELTITIPLPPRCMMKNANAPMSRGAKIGLSKAVSASRAGAKVAVQGRMRRKPQWERVKIEAHVYTGSKRPHDPHNLTYWLRGAIDGVQDALGIDDSRFVIDAVHHYEPSEFKRQVVLKIRELACGLKGGDDE